MMKILLLILLFSSLSLQQDNIEILRPGSKIYNVSQNVESQFQFSFQQNITAQIRIFLYTKKQQQLDLSYFVGALSLKNFQYIQAVRHIDTVPSEGLEIVDILDIDYRLYCGDDNQCDMLLQIVQGGANIELGIHLDYIYKDQEITPEEMSAQINQIQIPFWKDKSTTSPDETFYSEPIFVYKYFVSLLPGTYGIFSLRFNNLETDMIVKYNVQKDKQPVDNIHYYANGLKSQDYDELRKPGNPYQAYQFKQEIFECAQISTTQCRVYISIYVLPTGKYSTNKIDIQLLQTETDNIPMIKLNDPPMQFQLKDEKDPFETFIVDTLDIIQSDQSIFVDVQGCFDPTVAREKQQNLCRWQVCFYSLIENKTICEDERTIREYYYNELQPGYFGLIILNIHSVTYGYFANVTGILSVSEIVSSENILKDGQKYTSALEQYNYFIVDTGNSQEKQKLELYSAYNSSGIAYYLNFCDDLSECIPPSQSKCSVTALGQATNPIVLVTPEFKKSIKKYAFIQAYNLTRKSQLITLPTLFESAVYTLTPDSEYVPSPGLDGTQIAGIIMITLMGTSIIAGAAYYFWKKNQGVDIKDYESAQSEN